MKKIGILGGTFDPVHIGHIALAEDAMEQMGLDQVIFVPAKLQPFKLDKKVTQCEKRIEMLKLAIKDKGSFQVSAYELKSEGVSYTYKTMRGFKEILGTDAEVYFICGTDTFLKLKMWKMAENFLKENKFIVGSRPGYKDEQLNEEIIYLKENYNTQTYKINNRLVDVSSTMAREKMDEPLGNADGKDYIADEVKVYIEKNELYK